MTLEQAKQFYQSGKITQLFVMRNPENKGTWFVTARDERKHNFLLVDEQDKVMTFLSLEAVTAIAKEIGIKIIQVHV